MSGHYDDLETRSADRRAADSRRRCRGRSPRDGGGAGDGRASRRRSIPARSPTGRRSRGCRCCASRRSSRPRRRRRRSAASRRAGGRLRPGVPEPGADLRAGRAGAGLVADRPLPACLRRRAGRHRAELLFLPPDAGRDDVRERRGGGGGGGAAGGHRADRAAGGAARDLGATVYAGTPDYLKAILDAAAPAGSRSASARRRFRAARCFPRCGRRTRRRGSPAASAMRPPTSA